LAKRLKLRNGRDAASTVVVIGLGRFGGAVARELVSLDREVLGIDSVEERVQEFSSYLTHVVQADPTNEEALRDLGVADFDAAVVAIGSSLETSILSASLLIQLGVKQVWAKASSEAHGRILEQLDYVEIDEGFVMAKTKTAKAFVGKSLDQLGLRREYGIIVVATASGGTEYVAATPATVLGEGDLLIVAGPKDLIEKFSQI
jgi:trk system potassium uptake protein